VKKQLKLNTRLNVNKYKQVFYNINKIYHLNINKYYAFKIKLYGIQYDILMFVRLKKILCTYKWHLLRFLMFLYLKQGLVGNNNPLYLKKPNLKYLISYFRYLATLFYY